MGSRLDFQDAHLLLLCLGCAAALSLGGCEALGLSGFGTADPYESDFHKKTDTDLSDGGLPVVVMCTASPDLPAGTDNVDYDLAKHVGYRLVQNRVNVVDPDRVRDWLEAHVEGRTPIAAGHEFQAVYVVHLDLQQFTLVDEQDPEKYRGRAELVVRVIDRRKDERSAIYEQRIKLRLPNLAKRLPNLAKSKREYTLDSFTKIYLSALSLKIDTFLSGPFPQESTPNSDWVEGADAT